MHACCLKQAVEYAEKAHKISPEDGSIVYTLAFYQLQNGQKAAAVNNLKKALALNPGDLRNVQFLADIYLKDGNKSGAIKLYSDALKAEGLSGQDRAALQQAISALQQNS